MKIPVMPYPPLNKMQIVVKRTKEIMVKTCGFLRIVLYTKSCTFCIMATILIIWLIHFPREDGAQK